MKKVILILMMVFGLNICTFAEDNDVNNVNDIERYDFKVNHRRLATTLEMSLDQMEMSETVLNELANDMLFASSMESDESKNKIVSNAVKKNIRYMGYILNKEQYKKYITLLNLTLQNKGFDLSKIQ